MRNLVRTVLAGTLLCTVHTAAPAAASTPTGPSAPANALTIADQYLVTLAIGVDPASLLATLDAKPLFTYRTVMNGFAAKLTTAQTATLRKTPGVQAIQPDAQINVVTAPARTPNAAASWGIDRINQRQLPLDNNAATKHDGSVVTAYIIDTGIDYQHPEFSGRASLGYDAIGDGRQGADCNGHGTHVAGTVGGASFGVARAVKLKSIRVLGCDGRGTWSGVVAGFDWVAAHAVKPAVANVSLGGTPASSVVDNAADALADKGVFVAVAGGNDAAEACGYTPARAAKVFTIGATAKTDAFADYSNRGGCIQLLAPGTDVLSAKRGGGSVALSGTSMATPHVAGAAALYKHAFGDKGQQEIMTWLWNNGTPDRISGMPTNTPNRLLYLNGL